MAHADIPTTLTDHYPKEPVLARIWDWAGRTIQTMAENNPRLLRVQSLQAMTDAELDAQGITRDEIGHHVFHDVYYR